MQAAKRDPVNVYSGERIIDVANLQVDDVDIDEIALALAHLCRYNGHMKSFYSVAEHCIYVSKRVELMALKMGATPEQAQADALAGLMHDAAEAYIGDIVYPLKHSGMFDDYLALEEEIEAVITRAFELSPINAELVKIVDADITNWEKAIFREYTLREAPSSEAVQKAYLRRFHNLTSNRWSKW